ncbi:MAG: FtsX-like permease family protein [Nitrospirota bacterium]
MLFYLKLGIRNILKNRRRSLVTILAIAFGFLSINLFAGYVKNIRMGLSEQAIRGERLGHLTVAKKGFFTEGKIAPEKYLFTEEEAKKIITIMKADSQVEAVTPRLNLSGLVSNGKVSTIFLAEGLVPDDTRLFQESFRQTPKGVLDPKKPFAGSVSSDLAKLLNLKIGDSAVLLTATVDGLTNALDIEVGEIYNTGTAATNDKFLLLPFKFTQQLFDTEGADRLTVLLKDRSDTEPAVQRLTQKLADAGFAVEIKTWVELSAFYQQVVGMFTMIFLFIFVIVSAIVIMGIINTMTMAVIERTREIGTLRSIGMKRGKIVWLFSLEGTLLSLLGCGIGLPLIFLISQGINQAGIVYIPPDSSELVPLLIDLDFLRMGQSFLVLVLLTTVSALVPARSASRIKIVDALGHV